MGGSAFANITDGLVGMVASVVRAIETATVVLLGYV